MMLSKYFGDYTDEYGLIVKAGDGGDTCANQFTALYCGLGSYDDTARACRHLVRNGIPIRHPNPSKWYSSVNRTSRDQLTPYLAWAASNSRTSFYALAAQHAKHAFLFAWNTRKNFVYATEAEHAAKSTADVKWDYKWKLPDLCLFDIWAIYANSRYTPIVLKITLLPITFIAIAQCALAITRIKYQLRNNKFGPTSQGYVDHDRRNLTIKVHYLASNCRSILTSMLWKWWRPDAIKAAHSFWSQRHEPPLHLAIGNLR